MPATRPLAVRPAGGDLRLRTACDLQCDGIDIQRPQGFKLPTLSDLEQTLPGLIQTASAEVQFEQTTVTYSGGGKKRKAKKDSDATDENSED